MTAQLDTLVEESAYDNLGDLLQSLEEDGAYGMDEAAEAIRELKHRRSEVTMLLEALIAIETGDAPKERASKALRSLTERRLRKDMELEGANVEDLQEGAGQSGGAPSPPSPAEDPRPSVEEMANKPLGEQ